MTWEEMTSEVRARRQAATGDDTLPTARRRIGQLLDPGSFTEAGVLALSPVRGRDGIVSGGRPGGSVCGFGRNQRPARRGGMRRTARRRADVASPLGEAEERLGRIR